LTRKKLLLLTTFCLALLSFTARFKVSVKAQEYDWTVDPRASEGLQGYSKTIQGAIDNASSGQKIFVVNGTYFETITINKSISLFGEGEEFTTIDGNQGMNGMLSNVISITADNVTVKGFHVRNSSTTRGAAIRMDRANNNLIVENIISDSYDGIVISASNNNTIMSNIVTGNVDGMEISTSSNNILSKNTITNNYVEGIGITLSNNNMISNNTIRAPSLNARALGIVTSSNNIVKNNIISENSDGIVLSGSSNNIVTSNSIYLSTYAGIRLVSGSSNNILYHNNLNNSKQVEPDSSFMLPNTWDLNGEGNYWSDYNGTDANADGIGDTGHTIDRRNRDNNPLMGPFSYYYILFQEESFEIDIISNSTVTNFDFEIGAETGNRIIRFDAGGQEENGFFCRARIPNTLMNYSSILLVDEEEIIPKTLNSLDSTYSSLYFSNAHSNRTVSVISSKTLYLLNQLLEKYLQLQVTLGIQNNTYDHLVYNFNNLSNSYNQLKQAYDSLKSSYDSLLLAQSKSEDNNRSMLYVTAAATAVFLASTVYLSKRAHEKPSEPS
jgi:nitrous oxidase accessory protein